jgi:molybdopterin-synthase adenylyltransferase
MTAQQRERYSRQILFSGLQEEGQTKLLHSTAAIVGCGALGTFHAAALARAGVGRLLLIDRDYVELSNLQRQWLFQESDADQSLPKAIAAAQSIALINKDCRTDVLVSDLNSSNAEELLEEADVILDGTDNFETRYLINDFSVDRGRPWVYGGAVGSYGVSMTIVPGQTPCFRCVYPDAPTGAQPTCDTSGVLNTITSLVGALQVTEAIKLLSGRGEAISKKLTTVDLWTTEIRQIKLGTKDAHCLRQFPHLDGSCRTPISLCGRNAVQIHERQRPIDLLQLADRLQPLGSVKVNDFALRFFHDPYEMTIFPDGRAIIKGTQEVGLARSLYARFVGN